MQNNQAQKIAIFPGSFKPFHQGHQKIVTKALPLFDLIYVVVTKNINKKINYDFNEQKKIIEQLYQNEDKVKIIVNESQLTAQFAHELKAKFLIRGIRNETDARYEIDASWINNTLNNQLTTILFPSSIQDHKISSTLLREVASYGVDLKK